MVLTILTCIGGFLAAIFVIVIIGCFIVISKYLSWFHFRSCKHCGHRLEYKGLRENKDDAHYLFYCKKCGAWEQIPKDVFVGDLDHDSNLDGI